MLLVLNPLLVNIALFEKPPSIYLEDARAQGRRRQHLQVLEPVPMQVFFDCDENKCCERQEPLHPFHPHLF